MEKVLLAFMIGLLGACATSPELPKQRAGLLCIEKTDGSQEVVHCLNPLSADPADVKERVALHNAVQKKEDHIDCVYKQTIGSRFTRWRCFYANRPNVNYDANIGLLELIDRSVR